MNLPALLRKAVGNAGFDLAFGSNGEWQLIGVSGTEHTVWILPSSLGAVLAVAHKQLLQEFSATTWFEVPLPRNAVGAVRCQSAAELYSALRRVQTLLAQLPPAPLQRFAHRLASIDSTETEALLKQRIGQDLFRDMLLDYWDGRCALTGLQLPELLRASHAKPWKSCADAERLDVYNGLLLAVHLNALFDRGYMTFDDEGSPLFSRSLNAEAKLLLIGSIDLHRKIRLVEAHRPYIAYHRQHVFRNGVEAPITIST